MTAVWRICPECGERYVNAGAHAEACRGKPSPVRLEAVSPPPRAET